MRFYSVPYKIGIHYFSSDTVKRIAEKSRAFAYKRNRNSSQRKNLKKFKGNKRTAGHNRFFGLRQIFGKGLGVINRLQAENSFFIISGNRPLLNFSARSNKKFFIKYRVFFMKQGFIILKCYFFLLDI